MQAIILKRYNDFKLYNGETTTERIERLLKKHNISYNIYDKFPSFIQSPSMIIENNIVFDEQTLIENKTKEILKLYLDDEGINKLFNNSSFIKISSPKHRFFYN